MIVSDFCTIFLKEIDGHAAKRTQYAYSRLIINYIVPRVGSTKISEVTRCQVEGVIEASGARRTGFRVATGNSLLAIFRALFKKAQELGYVPRGFNPANDIPGYRQLRPPESLNDDEMLQLGAIIKNKVGNYIHINHTNLPIPPEFKLRLSRDIIDCGAMIFLLLSGVNQIDIKNLKWSDIDLDLSVIGVFHNSNSRYQLIPITRKMRIVLAALPRLGPYVFTGAISQVGIANLTTVWRHVTMAAGIRRKSIRAARHTFARNALEADVGSLRLMAMLGHAPDRKWQEKFHDPLANSQYWESVSNLIWSKMSLDDLKFLENDQPRSVTQKVE